MTRRRGSAALAAVIALAAGGPALADGHKLLVLQSEGRVDAATRAKIDAAVVKLAAAAEPQAAPGDLNFTDAATAVGCKPDAPSCKDEVLGMLGVDEIVITTVAPKPGGIEIVVRRVVKGGAARDATMLIATGAPPDKLDGIAPLFDSQPGPAITDRAPADGIPADRAPAEPALPAPTTVGEPRPSVVTAPPRAAMPQDAADPRRRRLELAGMAGGGGMVVLGLLLWGAASGVQNDIDTAPTSTAQDLAALRDLESKGDAYAGFGNLFAIGGVAVAGVATYFYLKDRRAAAATTARIAPALLDGGAGVVLSFGAP